MLDEDGMDRGVSVKPAKPVDEVAGARSRWEGFVQKSNAERLSSSKLPSAVELERRIDSAMNARQGRRLLRRDRLRSAVRVPSSSVAATGAPSSRWVTMPTGVQIERCR